MKKSELFKLYKNHLNALETYVKEYRMDKTQVIDQAYGFTLGISATHEKYFDEITEMWETWRYHIKFEIK